MVTRDEFVQSCLAVRISIPFHFSFLNQFYKESLGNEHILNQYDIKKTTLLLFIIFSFSEITFWDFSYTFSFVIGPLCVLSSFAWKKHCIWFQEKSSKECEKNKHTKRAFWLNLQAFKNILESVETITLQILKIMWLFFLKYLYQSGRIFRINKYFRI